uniref:PUB domain-containing protein n=1 Tax=Trypanosoma congolense (strain IL3000) TaxID=1068625 RepID=G0UW44_TRYCI|nr:conserved hypothetical protein [Trypanosoma congolense IL3000]
MAEQKEAENIPANEEGTSSDCSESEKKKYYISQALFELLQAKGFSDNAIKKSIVAGCVDEGTCTQWIKMHEGHPELDTPLEPGVQVVVRMKRILSEEEKEAKVKELREKARAIAEQEKRQAQEDERRRILMGRKALETREALDKIRRESEQAAFKKEKQQNLVARRRIRTQILTDKYIREGFKPEDARRRAEEQLDEEDRNRREQMLAQANVKQEDKPATSEVQSPSVWNVRAVTPLSKIFDQPPLPVSSFPELVAAVFNLEDAATSRHCVTMLRTILTNICAHPFDTTKRTLKTSTSAFCTKLLPVQPALQLLHACGFRLSTDPDGTETIAATTVVFRVINHAIEILSHQT